jgi:protocatechuate 3,4-dioxygenase, beta subunit
MSMARDAPALGRFSKWALGAITPATVMGPYFPVLNKPLKVDADLAAAAPDGKRAKGRALRVTGKVVDLRGRPAPRVTIEIWQANSNGRYDHPSDGNTAELDPCFKGYGLTLTDPEGRYAFETIIPAGYPVTRGWDRAPHIHFLLTGRYDRHVTQMWFPGEALNAQDRLLLNLPAADRPRVMAKLAPGTQDGATIAVFDIVLPNG